MTLWTSPRTWAVGETVTAANMNTHVRDNIKNLDEQTLFVRKATTQTKVSSDVLANDSALVMAVEANTTYTVDLVVRYDGSTASDLRIQFTAPASAVLTGMISGLSTAAASIDDIRNIAYLTGDASIVLGGLGVGVFAVFRLSGNLTVAATAGTFAFQWAQGITSTAETRVVAGSHLVLQRVVRP